MKIFSHKRLNGYKISRDALRHYALYRRVSIGNLPAGLNELTDFHVFESTGKLPDLIESFGQFSQQNAYANGKWIMRLTQDSIFDDIINGNASKAEFMNSSEIQKQFSKVKLSKHIFKYSATGWFTAKLVNSMCNSPATLFVYS